MVDSLDVLELVTMEFTTVVGWLNVLFFMSSLALALEPRVLERSGPKESRTWRVEFFHTEMPMLERSKRCGLVFVSLVACVIVIGIVRYSDNLSASVSVGHSQAEESKSQVGPEWDRR